ncbi:hypothetical protein TWF281_000050 [Arthrobotrys megalospora]
MTCAKAYHNVAMNCMTSIYTNADTKVPPKDVSETWNAFVKEHRWAISRRDWQAFVDLRERESQSIGVPLLERIQASQKH